MTPDEKEELLKPPPFTREDVRLLRAIEVSVRSPHDVPAAAMVQEHAFDLADRIEALLPPEDV